MKRSALATAVVTSLLATLPGMAETPPRSGPDFQVNVATYGDQSGPDVARLGLTGGFVVVWADAAAHLHASAIKGRLFRSPGVPAGDEFEVALAGDFALSAARVAVAPDGRFAVAWAAFSAGTRTVWLRRFDAAGQPLGDAQQLSFSPPFTKGEPDIAADPAGGGFLVVWESIGPFPPAGPGDMGSDILLQRIRPDGALMGGPFLLGKSASSGTASPRLAVNPAGVALASWSRSGSLFTRRRNGPDAAWLPEARVTPPDGISYGRAVPLLDADGGGALVFRRTSLADDQVAGVRLDAAGAVVDGEHVLGQQLIYDHPEAVLDPDGNVFVVWSAGAPLSQIQGQLFDRSWRPLGEAVRAQADPYELYFSNFFDWQPAAAVLGPGRFAVVWTDEGYDISNVTPIGLPDGRDESRAGVFGQIFGLPRCAAGSEVLCLGENGRFEARATWKTPAGQTGTARSAPLTTDTGALWFFDSRNLEVMIKVLDATTVNGYFWVFYGSLSNLEYTVTVKDTVTGQEKTYQNGQGRFASRADVKAFPAIGIGPAGGRTAEADEPIPTEPPVLDDALSLVGNRFFVEVAFTDPRTGLAGKGHAVQLTGDTGSFWFFDPRNLEVMIKVLDGRDSNGHFWVFCGGLSDVEYTFTVFDTFTGQVRTYHNNRRQLLSRADVEAF